MVALPRYSAARGKLAVARIDAIIQALAHETAHGGSNVFWRGSGGGSGGGGAGEGREVGGVGGGATLSEAVIGAIVSFADKD